MYKSIAQTEKMAAIENIADPKIIADGKIMVVPLTSACSTCQREKV